jgi:hypothetical protein
VAGRKATTATSKAAIARPAPTPNASRYPAVRASSDAVPPAARLPVRAAASVLSTATPSAAPTCCVVLTSPEVTPASEADAADMARVIIAGKASPNPPTSSMVGSR